MLIPDEQLEAMADEFQKLRLDLHGITLDQFINAPGICRDVAAERLRRKITAATGRADEPMKHKRFSRNPHKSDFNKRKPKGANA